MFVTSLLFCLWHKIAQLLHTLLGEKNRLILPLKQKGSVSIVFVLQTSLELFVLPERQQYRV